MLWEQIYAYLIDFQFLSLLLIFKYFLKKWLMAYIVNILSF